MKAHRPKICSLSCVAVLAIPSHHLTAPGPRSNPSPPQVLAGDAYRAAETDPLRTCAAALTRQMNEDRPEDMLRIRWGGWGEAGTWTWRKHVGGLGRLM